MGRERVTALALFSGGLDSILSCRVTMAQGIRVKAIRFVTPFFGHDLLGRPSEYREQTLEKLGIDVTIKDVSAPFLEMLKEPVHGYGKNFNPCLDCKILLMTEARKLMPEFGASLIISGEVLGQRPMSQRRDTMRVVERDSGCDGILVRPLCAKCMRPTRVEEQGLIDRDRLLGFSGRGRSEQIRLAGAFGITDYPAPAGGCLLTDTNISVRVADYYRENEKIIGDDVRLLLTGRRFILPGGGVLAVGRSETENAVVQTLAVKDDLILRMKDRPGPTAVLRYGVDPLDQCRAAGIVVRYGSKKNFGSGDPVVVLSGPGETIELRTPALADDVSRPWMR